MMTFISCEPIYICSLKVAFNCMEALLQRSDICSSNFNWLSMIIPSSFTDLVVSVILLSIFHELFWLFLSCFCKTIAWSLSGLTILFPLNHYCQLWFIFQSYRKVVSAFWYCRNSMPLAKLYRCDFFSTVNKSLRNILNKSIITVPATKFSSKTFFECSISLWETI